MFFQQNPRLIIECAIAKVFPEPLLMARFGGLALGLRQRNRRHQSELPVQIVQDANWHILVSIKKAPVLTEHAQLERKTPAVVVAAAALYFRAVGLG